MSGYHPRNARGHGSIDREGSSQSGQSGGSRRWVTTRPPMTNAPGLQSDLMNDATFADYFMNPAMVNTSQEHRPNADGDTLSQGNLSPGGTSRGGSTHIHGTRHGDGGQSHPFPTPAPIIAPQLSEDTRTRIDPMGTDIFSPNIVVKCILDRCIRTDYADHWAGVDDADQETRERWLQNFQTLDLGREPTSVELYKRLKIGKDDGFLDADGQELLSQLEESHGKFLNKHPEVGHIDPATSARLSEPILGTSSRTRLPKVIGSAASLVPSTQWNYHTPMHVGDNDFSRNQNEMLSQLGGMTDNLLQRYTQYMDQRLADLVAESRRAMFSEVDAAMRRSFREAFAPPPDLKKNMVTNDKILMKINRILF